MLNSYFGFSCSPFENTLDQRFLYFSEGHEEVISALLYFVKAKKSFALVCGDVGTGKTMIVHHFLSKLPRSVQPILIPYPDVEYIEILRYISRILQIVPGEKGILDLTDEVKAALTKESAKGKRFVLIIDEAHLLSLSSLEHIRLLSNIEITENKLLQIMLVGQNELSHKLRGKGMRQLRQRVNINRVLSPMSTTETIEYVDHRLKVAGSDFDSCFEPECKKEIFKRTGGVPRAINRLCDSALLIAKTRGAKKVNRKILVMADEALQSDILFTPTASPGNRTSQIWAGVRSLGIVAPYVILAVLIAILAFRGDLGTGARQAIHSFLPLKIDSPDSLSSGKSVTPSDDPASESKRYPLPKPAGTESISPATVAAEADSPPEAADPASAPATASPAANPDATSRAATEATTAIDQANPASVSTLDRALPQPEQALTQREPGAETGDEPEKAGSPGEAPENSTRSAKTEDTAIAFVPPYSLQEKPSASSAPSHRVVVRQGDTLASIAARWYPEKPAAGLKAILLANPAITDRHRIYPGQVLTVPELNPVDGTIPLRDNSHFAVYGRFNSLEKLREEMSRLTRYKVKYVVVNTTDSNGDAIYEILVGGYGSAQDLEKALSWIKSKTE